MLTRFSHIKRKWVFPILLLIGLCCLDACGSEDTAPGALAGQKRIPDKVDFNYHIKPILSDRCFKCHGPDERTREAGLGLHEAEAAFAALGDKKDHFAIVAGKPDESSMISRIFSDDPDLVMPPPDANLDLTDHEKKLLQKWIEQGAEWKKHWAFIPPTQTEIPQIESKTWAKNEIDHFVLAKLDEQQLEASGPASKEKLLRRVHFDLTGLPPTPEAVEAFNADSSEQAFEKVVDQLLGSDAYAERMATEWLDLARYADTHGYQDDFERLMWPWRDWVIHAFRKNLPYDQFVSWQLAGDLLPDPSLEQIIATGFNRNHKITAEGGVIDEEYRVEYVADRTQTFATAFLGLTMECARCHDHKYDPISQKEYYSLFSFFNNVPENGLMRYINRDGVSVAKPFITVSDKEIEEVVSFINNKDSLASLSLMVMEELPEKRQSFVLNRGQYDQHAEEVEAATPESVLPFSEKLPADRAGLAEWLFDPGNPLTARVAVNRLWQQLFGQGIVSSVVDFGNQGNLPSHPELLDYLSLKFQNEGWNIQAMLKYMILSATYQQSSDVTPKMLQIDPENRWLARASRRRLNAEMIRDQALQVSELLQKEVGGPSVKPYQPAGLWAETTGGGGGRTARYVQGKGEDLYRRSMYTYWKRTVPPPSMMTFDASSRDLCTIKRQETNTPLQALILLNDPQIVEAARVMASHAIALSNAPEERIRYMFQRCTSRKPAAKEIELLQQYLTEEKAHFEADPEAAKAYLQTGEHQLDTDLPTAEIAAWTFVANTILNLDEAITRG